MTILVAILWGVVGGVVGGALAGLGEAIVVALVSEASEYWVFALGPLYYGVFGAGVGGGIGALLALMRARAHALPVGAGAALALLALVVARFRLVRDVFAEHLPLFSTTGLLVHFGLLISACIAFVLLRFLLARQLVRRGAGAVAARWLIGEGGIALVLAAGLTAVFGGAGGAAPTPQAARADGPNILLIIADTLRADHIGPYGADDVATPALDALAADGIVFEHVFANSSWTRPSIATILTSLYAGSHSVMHKTDLLPDEVETLAERMNGAGYRTAGFVTNINVAPSFNFEQGFDTYEYLAPSFFFGATDSASKLALYSGMRLIRERFLSRKKYVEHYYQDAATVERHSVPWLKGNAAEPFFTLVHYMDPHDPYFELPYNGNAVARVDTPNPAPERAEELRRLYASNVEYMDEFLGKLFDALKAAGVYDDTIIAFTADHGEEFHEHGGWWHGTTLYDEAIHVPLIVKLAKQRDAGTRRDGLGGLVDVMPTVLAAAGLTCPQACQGRNLLEGADVHAIYAEEDHEGNVLEAIRTKDWKLIVANADNPRGLAPLELYDLRHDPGEQVNVADEHPEQVAALRKDLELLRASARASKVHGREGEIDESARERLRALGYIQ